MYRPGSNGSPYASDRNANGSAGGAGAAGGGGDAKDGSSPNAAATNSRHHTRAELRLQKDLGELSFSRFSANCDVRISFPSGVSKCTEFNCLISPQHGLYRRAGVEFAFRIPALYPFAPPIVHCTTKLYHPNIDHVQGDVALDLLKRDWKPVLSINTIIFGLQLLLLQPNIDNALNTESAALYRRSRRAFHSVLRSTLKGASYAGVNWDRVIDDEDDDKDSPECLLDDDGEEEDLMSASAPSSTSAAAAAAAAAAAVSSVAGSGSGSGSGGSALSFSTAGAAAAAAVGDGKTRAVSPVAGGSGGSSSSGDTARPPTSSRRGPLLKGQRKRQRGDEPHPPAASAATTNAATAAAASAAVGVSTSTAARANGVSPPALQPGATSLPSSWATTDWKASAHSPTAYAGRSPIPHASAAPSMYHRTHQLASTNEEPTGTTPATTAADTKSSGKTTPKDSGVNSADDDRATAHTGPRKRLQTHHERRSPSPRTKAAQLAAAASDAVSASNTDPNHSFLSFRADGTIVSPSGSSASASSTSSSSSAGTSHTPHRSMSALSSDSSVSTTSPTPVLSFDGLGHLNQKAVSVSQAASSRPGTIISITSSPFKTILNERTHTISRSNVQALYEKQNADKQKAKSAAESAAASSLSAAAAAALSSSHGNDNDTSGAIVRSNSNTMMDDDAKSTAKPTGAAAYYSSGFMSQQHTPAQPPLSLSPSPSRGSAGSATSHKSGGLNGESPPDSPHSLSPLVAPAATTASSGAFSFPTHLQIHPPAIAASSTSGNSGRAPSPAVADHQSVGSASSSANVYSPFAALSPIRPTQQQQQQLYHQSQSMYHSSAAAIPVASVGTGSKPATSVQHRPTTPTRATAAAAATPTPIATPAATSGASLYFSFGSQPQTPPPSGLANAPPAASTSVGATSGFFKPLQMNYASNTAATAATAAAAAANVASGGVSPKHAPKSPAGGVRAIAAATSANPYAAALPPPVHPASQQQQQQQPASNPYAGAFGGSGSGGGGGIFGSQQQQQQLLLQQQQQQQQKLYFQQQQQQQQQQQAAAAAVQHHAAAAAHHLQLHQQHQQHQQQVQHQQQLLMQHQHQQQQQMHLQQLHQQQQQQAAAAATASSHGFTFGVATPPAAAAPTAPPGGGTQFPLFGSVRSPARSPSPNVRA